MDEQIYLLVIIIFIIYILTKILVKMIKMDKNKYAIPIFFGRVLLGFLITMFIYIIILLFTGESILLRVLG